MDARTKIAEQIGLLLMANIELSAEIERLRQQQEKQNENTRPIPPQPGPDAQ